MARNSDSGRAITARPQSTSLDSLSERAVKKALRSDALQHPATILPLSISILSIIYLVVLSGLYGGSLWAIILLIASATISGGSFLWRYSVRYGGAYAERVQQITESQVRQQASAELAELTQTREVLRNGFESINLEPGLKTLNDLVYQFDELQPVLERRREVDPLGVAHVPALADETYRQGLSVLSDALELSRALRASSPESLEQEIARLEQELESLRRDEAQAERVRMAEARVRLNKERLELVGQQNLRVDQLLHQSDLCEAALARARLELAGLRADTAETSINAVTESLRTTMAQAREVQEELKKLGF